MEKEIDEVPAEWPMMSDAEQWHYMNTVNDEPDNIIPFRHPQFIDLTECF